MILIADSGSTKTDWVLLNDKKEIIVKNSTKGLNPSVFSESDLYKTITSNKEVMGNITAISELYFYGAGCGTATARKVIHEILEELFTAAVSWA